jgi:hypothetical protein
VFTRQPDSEGERRCQKTKRRLPRLSKALHNHSVGRQEQSEFLALFEPVWLIDRDWRRR